MPHTAMAALTGCTFVEPRGGFYVTLPIPDDEEKSAARLLGEAHILVHPGYFYDIRPDHLVMTFIHEPAVVDEAFGKIATSCRGDDDAQDLQDEHRAAVTRPPLQHLPFRERDHMAAFHDKWVAFPGRSTAARLWSRGILQPDSLVARRTNGPGLSNFVSRWMDFGNWHFSSRLWSGLSP